MLITNLSSSATQNIKGKIAIVTDECNLPHLFFTIKNIKDSEINLYLEVDGASYIINNIKDYYDNFGSTYNSSYNCSVTEIFSPFDYNVVICFGSDVLVNKVVNICNKYATPVKVLDGSGTTVLNSAKTA